MRTRAARWGLSTAVLVAAGLALTACGPDNGNSADGSSTTSPVATGSTQATTPPTATSGQGSSQATSPGSGTAGKSGVKCTDRIDYAGDPRSNAEINSIGEQTGSCPSPSPATGSGGATADNARTIVGTLEYLAPGKLIVKPQGGGTDQAFYVSNATTILGAAAICSGPDGNVTIGSDDYGTTKCTEGQLETAAKMSSVTVRVTLDRTSGGADTVAERYHP
ncbi:hypothetical protein [Streptomyces sp. NBC_00448]|uniref:hypothetical protein n=1 Tax=Streptomyces sp. NBC_00448 TaxID=2903652 RepID=UPI002E1C5A8F